MNHRTGLSTASAHLGRCMVPLPVPEKSSMQTTSPVLKEKGQLTSVSKLPKSSNQKFRQLAPCTTTCRRSPLCACSAKREVRPPKKKTPKKKKKRGAPEKAPRGQKKKKSKLEAREKKGGRLQVGLQRAAQAPQPRGVAPRAAPRLRKADLPRLRAARGGFGLGDWTSRESK